MNKDNYGGFSIACRLMTALRETPKEDPKQRWDRLLQSFLEKYSTNATDVIVLMDLLLAMPLPGTASPTESGKSMSFSVLDDVLIAAFDGFSLSDVPFASYGNLSLQEASVACRVARSVIRKEAPCASQSSTPSFWKSVAASATSSEWAVIKSIAVGDIHGTIGLHGEATRVLAALGPAAVHVFVTTKDLKSAVLSCCDGSPRMMRESSTVGTTREDDVDAGFASDDDEECRKAAAIAVAAPTIVASRVTDSSTAPPPTKVLRTEPALSTTTGEGTRTLHPCMYGADCRRKNPDHFKQYSHPPLRAVAAAAAPSGGGGGGDLGDAISAMSPGLPTKMVAPRPDFPPTSSPSVVDYSTTASTTATASGAASELDPKDFSIRGVAPLRAMKEHEFVFVENSGGGYKMKNCGGGTYTCNCPVWRYQNKGTNERTCKHLQTYLGSEFERVRCGDDGGAGVTAALPATGRGSPRAGSPVAGAKKVAMPGVLLANKATNKGDYTGWWVSEKLDGVRAYWDGQHLLSRNGNMFTAPEFFTKALPTDRTLDGELFGGRKKFQSTVGIVKSSAAHPGWATLTYELFDTPSSGDKPFETRMAELNTLFPKNGSVKHVHVVEQEKCLGAQHVADRLAEVEALGGEGLMLREPGSKYVHSRSNTLLKVKSTEECDAIVRAHDPGKGKHAGRCGALLVELANGKQFCVGSGLSDAQRNAPPKVGTVVVVKYQELTDGGIPRFPVFVGCRFDIDWPPTKKT